VLESDAEPSLEEGDEELASSDVSIANESAGSSLDESAGLDAADVRFSTPSRRATTSHIESIARRERKSAQRASMVSRAQALTYASPSKIAAAHGDLEALAAQDPVRPLGVRPFALGIITPRSLARYGGLLKMGFDELMAREAAAAAAAADPGAEHDADTPTPLLRSVELCMPEVNETASAFAARMRASRRFDVLLIQYHGSEGEQPVAFVEHSDSEQVPRILLLHRPEEILLRHEQHIYKVRKSDSCSPVRALHVVTHSCSCVILRYDYEYRPSSST